VIEAGFWERLAPYDGQWYLDIAENGYRRLGEAERYGGRLPPGNYAFFPLLPAALRVAKALFGGAFLPASILFLALSSAAGAALAWTLARKVGAPASLCVALLLAFPTAVFQLVLYTEGLFLALSAAALLLALRRRVAPAAVAGLLAGLCRPQGILLALPFAVEFLLPAVQRRESLSPAMLLARLAAVLAPLSGFLVLAVASASAADSSSAFIEIQGRWGRSYLPWNVFVSLQSAIGYVGPRADLLGLALGLGALPLIWRKLPLSLAVYGTAMLLLPLSTGSLLSLGRFLSVSLPHFFALGMLLQRAPVALRAGAVATLAAAQVLVANGLIAWHLVG
jgi:Gpi18-like mannosyltransferase